MTSATAAQETLWTDAFACLRAKTKSGEISWAHGVFCLPGRVAPVRGFGTVFNCWQIVFFSEGGRDPELWISHGRETKQWPVDAVDCRDLLQEIDTRAETRYRVWLQDLLNHENCRHSGE